jgi:universal stress protein A
MKPFTKILVPVDFSPHSEQAVRVAAELARRYDAALGIIHVYEPIAYALPEGYVLMSHEQLNELWRRFDQELAAVKKLATEGGAPRVETHLLQGLAVDEICAVAEKQGFDLIVMGTQGRRGLSHLLIGSVAERVLRLAPCPVLTVKASLAEPTPKK